MVAHCETFKSKDFNTIISYGKEKSIFIEGVLSNVW